VDPARPHRRASWSTPEPTLALDPSLSPAAGRLTVHSQTCEKYQIRPSQFYQWERTAEQAATEALRGQKRGRRKTNPREEELLAEIERLRAVIAEISMENLALKKGAWR
jgi:transposase-like protein